MMKVVRQKSHLLFYLGVRNQKSEQRLPKKAKICDGTQPKKEIK